MPNILIEQCATPKYGHDTSCPYVWIPRGTISLYGLTLIVLLMMTFSVSAQTPVGLFDGHTDVGMVNHSGNAIYNGHSQTYHLSGSGENMWYDRDAFSFLWKRMEGDFVLRARARFLGDGVDPHRKLGWMVRSSLDADAAYADATVHGDGLTSLQFRRTPGAETEEVQSSAMAPDVIQLARKGKVYTLSVARLGEPFTREEIELDLGNAVYVGLFVCAHNADAVEEAVFENVRVIRQAADDFVANRDPFLGSNLEVLNVDTGERTVLHRISTSLQAPNWTPDGKALIYNQEGLLYRFDLEARQPEVIDTGFADRNNNDHVISFDGQTLAISHHAEEHDGQSVIYTLPTTGGTPKQVTPTGPSYLHGISPDGQYLTYVARRGEADHYDVYRIRTEGGAEERLTETEGLDDGPEYTPDGKYIYFNSVRSGNMQLWRMGPNGETPEQLTFDELNDWFPHISPDGKRVAFISYLPEVPPGAHPYYKQVYLRLMPADGGTPRIIGYVYGGQGTINVPSWSPDGKYIAFVSNG